MNQATAGRTLARVGTMEAAKFSPEALLSFWPVGSRMLESFGNIHLGTVYARFGETSNSLGKHKTN